MEMAPFSPSEKKMSNARDTVEQSVNLYTQFITCQLIRYTYIKLMCCNTAGLQYMLPFVEILMGQCFVLEK